MNHKMFQQLKKESNVIKIYNNHETWREVHCLFPPEIVREMAHFIVKNNLSITFSLNGEARYHCCKRCLKAHLVVASRKYKLSKEALFFLNRLFPEKTGHEGYYLNEENLLKISKARCATAA